MNDDQADDGAGAHPLPRRAARGHRGARGAAIRRCLGDLRPRQRRRARRSALPASRGVADLSCAQRAGDGPRGDRVREGAVPAADDGVHDIDRSRRHEPRHGGGDRACQSAARAFPSGRHLRFARARSGAAADRGFRGSRRFRKRLLSAGLAIFRADHGACAAADRTAVRDRRADGSRAMRSGDARAAAGRAGGGVRLPRVIFRAERAPDAGRRRTRRRHRRCRGAHSRVASGLSSLAAAA